MLIKDYFSDSKLLVVILFTQSNQILLDFPNVNVTILRNDYRSYFKSYFKIIQAYHLTLKDN